MKGRENARRAADFFKALSVESRVRIINILAERPLCVNALSVRLGMTPGAVSQHLRVLRSTGLVTGEKRGNFVHYRLDEKGLDAWRKTVNGMLGPGRADPGCHAAGGGEEPCAAATKRKKDA